ncbi:hypothetical protein [Amycolatopsis viridis]|uniref:Uncharacterized protein n=1 Tax=Amycolatopsis viridis TaxID=185678 RepID=A0ABX0SQX2_9PSEU|nr:hypothetical protein [Amycolatopsis viridis]NIH79283.1 hypothetical protein [Amycolatopsis viridis]
MPENRWPADLEIVARGHRLVASHEVLRHGAEGALQALLHAAAHGLAAARGITDTSRRGRYHNNRFVALAEELGLEVADAGRPGWAVTTVPPATAAAYTAELDDLSPALAELPEPQPYRPPAEAQHSRGKLRAVVPATAADLGRPCTANERGAAVAGARPDRGRRPGKRAIPRNLLVRATSVSRA